MQFLLATNVVVLIIVIIIALGTLLFILTGVMHIKKGYEAVIEKLDTFYVVFKQGFHYLPPFSYHRVGIYRVTPTQKIIKVNGQTIEFFYSISDVKTYHYNGHNVNEVFQKAETKNTIEECVEYLKTELPKIGVKLLKKGEFKKNVFE